MKTLVVIVMLWSLTAVFTVTAAVTVRTIDNGDLNNSTTTAGFSSIALAGGNVAGVPEFGVGAPGSLNPTVDVGTWDWGYAYSYSITKTAGGVVTFTIGEFSAAPFVMSEAFAGVAFVAYANFPLVYVDATVIVDGNQLAPLHAGWGENTSMAYAMEGDFESITGTLTITSQLAGAGLYPAGDSAYFRVAGLRNSVITPEPTRALLMLIGFLSLFLKRER